MVGSSYVPNMLLTYFKAWSLLACAVTVAAGQTSSIDKCPGYEASNVVTTGSTLTANLHLAGPACNVYGTDLTDLKLVVEYQTGKTPGRSQAYLHLGANPYL